MSRRIFAILVAIVATAVPSTLIAGELPRLRVATPEPGDKYEPFSSIAIIGESAPAIQTNINVAIYHVLPTGRLVRQAGCSFTLPTNGFFGITLDPPTAGWIPGPMRAVVTLVDLPQVKAAIDFQAAGDPVAVPWAGAAEPKPSDLVVQLPLPEVMVFDLPTKVTFLVEGEFKTKQQLKGVTGPKVHCSLEHIREDATRVTYDGAIGPTFVQPDGSCWYQIQLKSPEKPGLYHVKFTTLPLDAVEGEPFGTSEFPFSIRVTEQMPAEKAAPKP